MSPAELTRTNRRLQFEITVRKEAADELRNELRALRRILWAHDRDRQLIAYDIHDGLSQQLAAAIMELETFERLRAAGADEASSQRSFEAGMNILRESLVEARRLISGVQPPVLDEAGVVAAIEKLIQESRGRGGPEIEFLKPVASSQKRLEPALENAIYRITQAALNNALCHSGSKRVRVAIVEKEGRVRITVQDWGIGFVPTALHEGRFGIESIRQRARLLGGTATIQSAPGRGTTVTVEVPLVVEEPDGG